MGIDLKILEASIQSDFSHKQKVLDDLYDLIDNKPAQKTIAILGLSFRADTDDIRASPARMIIKKLLTDGVRVKAYDPKAMALMKEIFPKVIYCDTPYQAAQDANALLLLTEWDEFKTLDLKRLAGLMTQRIAMDTRNIWSHKALEDAGFTIKKHESM